MLICDINSQHLYYVMHLARASKFIVKVIISTLFFALYTSSISAATSGIASKEDWEKGVLNDIVTPSTGNGIEIESDGNWGAQAWQHPQEVLTIGTSFTTDGTDIYLFRGAGDTDFWKYTPTENTWTKLANSPFGVYYGSEMEYLDGYVYAFPGGYQSKFIRYSIANNSWEIKDVYPELVYRGASMATDGTYIYAVTGNNTQSFYRYDVAGEHWDPLTGLPAAINQGADLIYNSGYIYTPRGNGTNTMYRYDIGANTWTTRANLPAVLNGDTEMTLYNGEIYLSYQTNTTTFYKYNIAGNTWSIRTAAPLASQYAGVIYMPVDGNIYFFRGNGDYRFWKYNPTTNAYIGPAEAPATLGAGSNFVHNAGYIYTLRGGNTNTLYRYHIAGNTWTTMTNAPTTFNDYNDSVVAGGDIYFLRGGGTQSFYKYNIAGNSWTTLTNTPATMSYYANLAYPGSGDFIYATRGGGNLNFYRYSISGNSWSAMSSLPATAPQTYGSVLFSDITYVYMLGGLGNSRMYRYNIGGNTWTELTNLLPFAPYYGTDVTYDGGDKFYATAGYYKREMWEYTISTGTWRRLSDFLGVAPTYWGAYAASSIVYVSPSSVYMGLANGRTETYLYSISANAYKDSGTWISSSIDLGYVDSWNQLTVTSTTPSDSTIQISTRTSSDGVTWSSWSALSGNNITSSVNKYIQVRAILYASTDNTRTPKLETITIDYNADSTSPDNVSAVTGLSNETGGVSITSGQSYPHINPVFNWSVPSDTGSGVAGYYVYFGPDINADPYLLGSFQNSTSYIVTKALTTGNNYLKIVTEDNKGNRSSSANLFTYIYAGVSPVNNLTVNSGSFNGTFTNTAVNNNKIKLANKSGGFWDQDLLSPAPITFSYGSRGIAYVQSTGKVYMSSGSSNVIREYDLETDVWTTLANAPGTIKYGGGLVHGPNDYIYALAGNNSTGFWRYDISSNTWDAAISPVPLTIGYGGSLVYDNYRYIYVMRGNNSDIFWRYDTYDDAWETLDRLDFDSPDSTPTNNANAGANITIDLENNKIYGTQGGTYPGFSVYNMDTDQWSFIGNLPIIPNDGTFIHYDPDTDAVYLLGGNNTATLYKYTVSENSWTQLASAPAIVGYGGAMKLIDGGQFFMARAGNTSQVYKYDIAKDSWLMPRRGLFGTEFENTVTLTANYGADVLKGDGSNYYIVRGNYGDEFIRWNEDTGVVTKLANAPAGIYAGGSLVYAPNLDRIYMTSGNNDARFFYYSISSNTWSVETLDPMPAAASFGASMVYDGSRYIYATRGNGNTNFYRYDTQASAGARWSSMTVIPLAISYGSELLINGDHIYTLRGNNINPNNFYRYSISGNSWTSLTSLNTAVYNDAFLVNGNNGYLYAASANNTTNFYRYSISGNTWTQLNRAVTRYSAGAAGESNGNSTIYSLSGAATNAYSDGLHKYTAESDTTGFVSSGSYISQVHDFTTVFKWGDMSVDFEKNSDSNIAIYTRSSSDNSVWSDWSLVSREKAVGNVRSYKINSNAQRYLQVKFELLSSNGLASTYVNNYSINYFQDTQEPTNPDNAGIVATGDGNPITNNTWNNYDDPSFNWAQAEQVNGATDGSGGSGVEGYYVYWGTNSGADPAVLGTFQTSNSFTPTLLDDNSIYRLRIKTRDNAGNVASTTWEPFIYKYDLTPPSVPANAVSDPSGYSSTDSFDFSWDASSALGATITDYCYKTGASSGQYASDTCISGTDVTGIPSYRIGANTFYVRVKDQAGNYSNYTTVSYFYVDSGNAPAAPTNLAVTPTSSTSNSFAFDWDPPANGTFYGSVSNLKYLYSINALPTEFSVSETSLTYLNAGAYATLPGDNVFYIVTKDEAGNVNYNSYTSVTFTANTVAPGIPTNVEIADVSVKSSSSWRLAISWDAPSDVGSGVGGYQIFRSLDGTNFSYHSYTSGSSLVDTNLLQQVYYYKVKACDDTNNCGAFSTTVNMYPDGKYTAAADLLVNPEIFGVAPKKASVKWITSRTADSKIAYGTKPGEYFDEEVGNSDQVVNHELTINNLTPNTKYYYIVKWTDEDGNTGVSTEASFTTNPPPTIEEPIVRKVGLDFAFIEFKTKETSKIKVLYGDSSAFGGVIEVSTGTALATQTVELTELKDGTKYFYKINTFDSDGAEYEGEIHSFQTLPRPKVSKNKIYQVSGTSTTTLLIEWETNTATSSIVTYYPSNAPSKALDEVNVTLKKGLHRMVILRLEPNTTYSIEISGRDFMGNEANSGVLTYTTAADLRPPQVYDLEVSTEIQGTGAEATAQLVVSYKTDEPATSQVEFGEGTGTVYSQKSQEDSNLTLNHIVILSGLTPSKVYHLRAISKDLNKNIGVSIDKVVVTNNATENALDLAINNLVSIFSFFR
jgi:hypothetical protein